MASITATIGADAAPLKKELQTAETLAKATSKKIAEDSKKAAKEAEQAQKDAAKKQVEAHQRVRGAVTSVVGSLANAETGAQAFQGALGAAGEALKLGAAGTIGLTVLTSFVGRIDEATQHARELKDEMSHVVAPQSGAGRSSVSEISGHLQDALALGKKLNDELQGPSAKPVILEAITDTLAGFRQAEGFLGKAKALFGGGYANIRDVIKTDKYEERNTRRQDEAQAAAQKDVDRLAEKQKQLLDLRERGLKFGEREGEVAKILADAEERRGSINEQAKKASEAGQSINVSGLTKQVDADATAQIAEATRKADDVLRDFGQTAATASAQSAEATIALTGKIDALHAAIRRVKDEGAKEKLLSNDENNERHLDHLAKANAKLQEQKGLERELLTTQRSLAAAAVDGANAQAQGQINVEMTMNRQLAVKHQLALYDKELADLAERRKTADEAGAIAIDNQNAAIQNQITTLKNAQALKTPAQKQAEKAQDEHAERLIHKAENAEIGKGTNHPDDKHPDEKHPDEKHPDDAAKNRRPWRVGRPAETGNEEFFKGVHDRKAAVPAINIKPPVIPIIGARPGGPGMGAPDMRVAIADGFDKSQTAAAILKLANKKTAVFAGIVIVALFPLFG